MLHLGIIATLVWLGIVDLVVRGYWKEGYRSVLLECRELLGVVVYCCLVGHHRVLFESSVLLEGWVSFCIVGCFGNSCRLFLFVY